MCLHPVATSLICFFPPLSLRETRYPSHEEASWVFFVGVKKSRPDGENVALEFSWFSREQSLFCETVRLRIDVLSIPREQRIFRHELFPPFFFLLPINLACVRRRAVRARIVEWEEEEGRENPVNCREEISRDEPRRSGREERISHGGG